MLARTLLGSALSVMLVAACAAPAAEPASSAPSPSVAPTPTATAAVVSPTPVAAWQLATIPPAVHGWLATPMAVAVGGGHLVAVGGVVSRHPFAEGPWYGGIWTSVDGLVWTPASLDPVLEVGNLQPTSGPQIGLSDVAYGPGGFVVLGHTGFPGKGVRVGLWRSSDGETWERTDLPDALFAGARVAAFEPEARAI